MAKKKQDPKVTAAIIGGIVAVIVGVVSAPIIDSMWKDRPIAYLSLGWEKEYPKSKLQSDEIGYYVEIVLWNEGKTAGKTIFVAQGTNAEVRLGKTSVWSNEQRLPFTILPESSLRTYQIYVLPNEDSDTFSITFWTEESNEKPLFQELTVFRPTLLTYENKNGIYEVITRDNVNIQTGQ